MLSKMDGCGKEESPLLGRDAPNSLTPKSRSHTFSSYGSADDGEDLYGNDKVNTTGTILTTLASLDQTLSHCHGKEQHGQRNRNGPDTRARRTLIIASVLCLSFMVAEIIGGYLASSLAIMTDAAHLLTDFASFMISLFSLFLAARPATRRMSFGWHRAEVLGAFASVLLIWVITGVLVYIAVERIINKSYDVDGEIMLITASVGVGVNLIMGFILHRGGAHGHSHSVSHPNRRDVSQHKKISNSVEHAQENRHGTETTPGTVTATVTKEATVIDMQTSESPHEHREHHEEEETTSANINVRAAFIHVIGDFLQSLGVLVAALVIYFEPHLGVIDPICTFIFSVLVLLTTLAIMRDALNVLMEGLPRGVDFGEVTESLLALDGVERVHDLRIWSLTMDKTALAVHLAVDRKHDTQTVLRKATELLRRRYQVYECTVQIEHFSADMNDCQRCEVPKA